MDWVNLTARMRVAAWQTRQRRSAIAHCWLLKTCTLWRPSATTSKGVGVSLTNPNAVWHAWRRARAEHDKMTATDYHLAAGVTGRSRESATWHAGVSQDAVRRAIEAMLVCQSSNLLVLARCALQAAARNEADLMAILEPAVGRSPERVAEPAL